jgi:hypothetical protein
MRRVAALFVAILALGLAPALAQAFLPGLPSFGGFLGGPATCGEGFAPKIPGPTIHAGWMLKDRPTSFGIGAETVGLSGVVDVRQSYPLEGLWLGLSQTFVLSENFSILGSGWYLVPGSGPRKNSHEAWNEGEVERFWTKKEEWWFADGLLAISTRGGGAFLVGARYDYYTTRFTDPLTKGFPNDPGINDESDLISNNVIPLIGLQWACTSATSNLVMRAVGIPTLAGNVKYQETFFSGIRLETKGNWKGGYFLEFFGEASHSFFGGGSKAGVFARWNTAHGEANMETDVLSSIPTGNLILNDRFRLGFTRNTWTLGANFQLDFAMPMPY